MARTARAPKLLDNPEKSSGRFYSTFMGLDGKQKRRRFTRSHPESVVHHARWVALNWNPDGTLIPGADPESDEYLATVPEVASSATATSSRASEPQPTHPQSMGHIVIAYITHLWSRVREPDTPRRKGTMKGPTAEQYGAVLKTISEWFKEHCRDRMRIVPFAALVRPEHYDALMTEVAKTGSNSLVNKTRWVFWDLARFARGEPYRQVLSFTKEDVRKFGGSENSGEQHTPSIEQIRLLCRYATTRERLWLWMAIGLGFGQKDLSNCRLENLDAETYDQPRTKNLKPRYGTMPPLVWALLQEYLKETPRRPDDLLFVTTNGHPLVREVPKTEEEMRDGTSTRPPKTNRYKKVDAVGNAYNNLKEMVKSQTGSKYAGGFYTFRHLGATAFGNKHGSILQVRTFLGDSTSAMADHYMNPLRAGVKKTVDWVNTILQSSDPLAWEDKPTEFARAQEWRRTWRSRAQKGKKHNRRKADAA